MLRNDTTSARLRLTRRLAFAVLMMFALPHAALAQGDVWPPKLVRIIVPFGPGASPDIVGRVIADSLQARHPGTNFVVENKPGASGNIGTDAIAKAPTARPSAFRWAAHSPSTRCCSRGCPTIPIPTSRRSPC